MLHVQKFLRDGGTLEELTKRYSISVKRHKSYPNLVLLKYDQIESPFGEEIVRECRGIILDQDENWRVVSLAFTKFFNHGEGHAAEINWHSARVQEKIDGSLCVLYFYDGIWHVATSGTPDASGPVGKTDRTFRDLFWDVFMRSGYYDPAKLRPTKCYSFELTTPENRVVVPHTDSKITLIGVRDVETLREEPVSEYTGQFSVVREFPLQSFEQVEETFRQLNPLHQEGYVIVDAMFNRVKVKHPGYVALHHMRDGFTKRRILEVVRSGETPEFLAHFPEFQAEFDEVKTKYDALVTELESHYAEIKNIPEQKAFALKAKDSRCSGALFAVRAGKKPSFKHVLADMNLDHLASTLGVSTHA
jgi:hypothetical protein